MSRPGILPTPPTAVLVALLALWHGSAAATSLDIDEAATYFGRLPAVFGMRLSPDGGKISTLMYHPEGFPIAVVRSLATGEGSMILASDPKGGADISRCLWANDSRLLCSYFGLWNMRGTWLPSTRLIAVDAGGGNRTAIAERQQRNNFALFQDEIVDLIPNDPTKIWIEFDEGRGQGVSEADIYDNRLRTVVRPKESVWEYRSDGRGEVRLRLDFDRRWANWEYRTAGDKRFRHLHRFKPQDLDDVYWPLAFGTDPNVLLVTDWHEGRQAIWAEKLVDDPDAPRERTLQFSHERVDVGAIARIGKRLRGVGVYYTTDKARIEYFDPRIKEIDAAVSDHLGTHMDIRYVDESWDRRFYLVHASSDVDSGAWYRYDADKDSLTLITRSFPWIEERVDLAPMKAIEYPAKDGTPIPGYLTVSTTTEGARPLILLPHGGLDTRDVWGFDRIVQFLASQGYAVLQANYRGSGGYGKEWLGRGAFHQWQTVVEDLDAGIAHLVQAGIADPDRICILGRDFGGYAALITAIERSERLRCVVAFEPITHPYKLYSDLRRPASWDARYLHEIIPRDGDAVRQSSPLKRVEELSIPALVLDSERDNGVEQSQDFAKAAKKAKKDVEYVEFEDIDHPFRRSEDAIEFLQRVGDFLSEHLAPRPSVEVSSAFE